MPQSYQIIRIIARVADLQTCLTTLHWEAVRFIIADGIILFKKNGLIRYYVGKNAGENFNLYFDFEYMDRQLKKPGDTGNMWHSI